MKAAFVYKCQRPIVYDISKNGKSAYVIIENCSASMERCSNSN